MVEEAKQEETNKEKPEIESKSVIEIAQKLKEQIKAENDRREELLKREEALEARKILGGRTDAGQEKPKEDPAKKLADEIAGAFKGRR